MTGTAKVLGVELEAAAAILGIDEVKGLMGGLVIALDDSAERVLRIYR